MSKTNTKPSVVKAIMAYLAQGHSVSKASKKFNISTSGINSMINAKSHTDVTGLTAENRGLDYIRSNKNMYINVGAKNIMAKKPSPVKITTPSKAKSTSKGRVPNNHTPPKMPTVETVTRIVEPIGKAGKGSSIYVDFSENVDAIHSQAKAIVAKVDARMVEVRAELAELEANRAHWDSFTVTM